jgi:hypothetical protein
MKQHGTEEEKNSTVGARCGTRTKKAMELLADELDWGGASQREREGGERKTRAAYSYRDDLRLFKGESFSALMQTQPDLQVF